ncbi:hypothetical protein TNCV_3684681 [Trichonephila clavipes]|uniref:Uncharacterized protein n=1 Tax=Trichonephila clavipes TaxID=2585209 RepID=A0A8X6UWH3_TRICX|nr:hypothetical protein TNCV_3684681 [Trichonephila clavipes]
MSNNTGVICLIDSCGRGSLVVKVTDSWPTCRAFESRTAEDPLRREAMHLNDRLIGWIHDETVTQEKFIPHLSSEDF